MRTREEELCVNVEILEESEGNDAKFKPKYKGNSEEVDYDENNNDDKDNDEENDTSNVEANDNENNEIDKIDDEDDWRDENNGDAKGVDRSIESIGDEGNHEEIAWLQSIKSTSKRKGDCRSR